MAKKIRKKKKMQEATYLDIYKHICGIKGEIAYIELKLCGHKYIKAFDKDYDELDAKEREIAFIAKMLEKTPHLKAVYKMRCDLDKMSRYSETLGLTKNMLTKILKEESYYLFHHIVGYEERCEE